MTSFARRFSSGRRLPALIRVWCATLCPHVIGKGKDGAAKALSLQFAGETSSGSLPKGGEWRCMAVDEMLNVEVIAGDWHTLANHSRPQSCVKQVDVEVNY